MKKKTIRIISIILALSFSLMLSAACSDKQSTPEKTLDYVYLPEYVKLPKEINAIRSVAFSDKTIFLATESWDEENGIISSEISTLNKETNEVAQLPNYVTKKPAPDAEGWIEITLCIDNENNLWSSESGHFWTYNFPDDFDADKDEPWEYSEDLGNILSLRKLDESGAEISTVDINKLSPDSTSIQINAFDFDKNGNIYISAEGDGQVFDNENTVVFVLGSDGNLLFNLTADSWVRKFIHMKDGTIAISDYNNTSDNVWTKVLRPVNVDTKSFGEDISIPDSSDDIFGGNEDFDLIYTMNSGIYGMNFGDEQSIALLNWIDSGFLPSYVDNLTFLDDGRILVSSETFLEKPNSEQTGPTVELALLSKTPTADLPEIETITLGSLWLGTELTKAVIEFNKTNTAYRIKTLDYSEYNTDDDWNAGRAKLSADIIAGNIPDILDMSTLPFRQYVSRGLLRDLYEFLDSDADLSRDSFVDGVLNAAEMDGGLYELFTSFQVNTIAGHPNVLGPETSWTMEEFNTVIKNNPQADIPMGQYITQGDFVGSSVMLNIDKYVDWSKGTASFDSQEFIDLLEFASSLPANWEDTEGGSSDEYVEDAEYIAQGRQIMDLTHVWGFDPITEFRSKFGGNFVYKGFPADGVSGNTLSVDNALSITEACSNPQAAWSFVKILISEDFQTYNVWSFPSNKAAFDNAAKNAMTRDDIIGWSSSGGEYTIKPLTKAELDQVTELIRSAAGLTGWDEALLNIINEDIADYFSGQCYAADAARVIQSRASIYVSEQG